MMWLVASGILYLIGIATVLAFKPSFMFTEDGVWKEFGIGRNYNTHTWMPFWLFAVLWALISYIIVVLLFAIFGGKTSKKGELEIIQTLHEAGPDDMEIDVVTKPKRRARSASLADGYYVLNRKATEAAGGVPKYVYLGKGLPE